MKDTATPNSKKSLNPLLNIECDICNSELVLFFKYNEGFSFYSCKECGYVKRMPDNLIIDYSSEYMNDELIGKSKVLANNYYSRLSKYVENGSTVLEIGGSFGFFGKLLEERKNCEVFNVELSALASDYSRNINKIKTVNGIEQINEATQFDIIFSFHVIEHILPVCINGFIGQAVAKLKENGKLILLTPNGNAIKLKIFKKNYPWIAFPEHISFLTSDSVKILFERNNLIIETNHAEIPSYYHYPSLSIISSLVKILLTQSHETGELKESLKQDKASIFNLLKKIMRNMLFIERMIFLPFHYLTDIFSKNKDELVVISKKENAKT